MPRNAGSSNLERHMTQNIFITSCGILFFCVLACQAWGVNRWFRASEVSLKKVAAERGTPLNAYLTCVVMCFSNRVARERVTDPVVALEITRCATRWDRKLPPFFYLGRTFLVGFLLFALSVFLSGFFGN